MVETSSSSESKSPSWLSSSSARTLLTDSWSRWSSPSVDRLHQDGERRKVSDAGPSLPFIFFNYLIYFIYLLEDVRAEDGGQCAGVPALLLERGHAGQEAAQEAQEAVVQLGKLLQEVLEVSTQLLVIAVIWGIRTAEKSHRFGSNAVTKPPGLNCWFFKLDRKSSSLQCRYIECTV